MKYLLISVFIHVFFIISLTFLNVEQGKVTPESTLVVDVIPAAYKHTAQKVVKSNVSKASKITRKLRKKTTFTPKVAESTASVDTKNVETVLTAEQVKQAQLSYVQKLKLYIEQNKHYPRQAIRLKQSGVVKLRLKISRTGVFSGIEILGSSDFPILDEAALMLIKKIGKFKPLPSKIKSDSYFTLPIAYSLRR